MPKSVQNAPKRDSRGAKGTMRMLIPPTKLRGDLLSLAELGVDPHAFIKGSGVTYDAILAQVPIRQAKIVELYSLMGAAVPRDLAVRCGRSIKLQYLGLLGYRLSNCATVGELLADWIEHCGHIGYPLSATLDIRGETWRMSFTPRFPLAPDAESFCVTSTLAGFAQSVFNLSGHRIRLRRIGFPGPGLPGMDAFDQLDATELLFGEPIPFVEGTRGDLELRIVTADTHLLGIFDGLCRQAWSANSASLTERLGKLLRENGPLDLARSSDLLCMSARSLQRHLASEGKGFSDILDEYRHVHALRLLRQGRASKHIAHELGFEDCSSFRRSFRRWTGQSLSHWLHDYGQSYAQST
jgi:AraC-like DNA-binding protein